MATYRAAVERWPRGAITLRQGARVIEDSRPDASCIAMARQRSRGRTLTMGCEVLIAVYGMT
jgi:hypothetical protein